MNTAHPLLLLVRIREVPADKEASWNTWYDTVHLQNRLNKPGFLGARRYRALWGEYRYLTLYDLASLDALTSPPYLELRDWEKSLPPETFEWQTLRLPGFARGIYERIFPVEGSAQSPDAKILFTVGHDVPANREEEFNAWYNTEHLPAMVGRVPGFLAGRRFRLVETDLGARSGLRTPGPKYVTLYDLADDKVLDTDVFKKETQSPWSAWVRSWYTRRFRILATRIYPGGTTA